MEPCKPLDDAQKRFHGKLAGSRGGGFAEIINPGIRHCPQITPSKKAKKKLRELVGEVLSGKK